MDALFDSPNNKLDPRDWAAHLDIHFEEREHTTKIAHTSHYGPLRIQRPFYPESNGTAHVYLLHPPGGVAGGDRLSVKIESGARSRALLTTPAATKLYRSIGPKCGVEQLLTVREDAILEWLPQETIAFSGAQAELKTIVQLETGAQFIGWEILCLGRPACGDDFDQGRIDQRIEVWRGDLPLFVDRLVVGENSPVRDAPWGMNHKSVVAMMFIVSEHRELLSLLRETLKRVNLSPGILHCTALFGVSLVRYVGDSVPECWAAFVRVWEMVRSSITGSVASLPRIWAC